MTGTTIKKRSTKITFTSSKTTLVELVVIICYTMIQFKALVTSTVYVHILLCIVLLMCQCLQINWTPLHYAAQYGETEVAVFLINNGANLDAVMRLVSNNYYTKY